MIHFPIVFLVVGASAMILGVLFGSPTLLRGGAWSLLAGVITGVATLATGLMSVDDAIARGVSEGETREHRNLAIAALLVALFASSMWLVGQRVGSKPSTHRFSLLAPGLAVAAAGLAGWAAHEGGTMVHPRLQLTRVLGLDEPGAKDVPKVAVPPALTFQGQVEVGAQVFANECAECHGDDALGGELIPSLVGPDSFAHTGEFKNARELFDFVSTRMPNLAPGSLTAEEYQAVTAWLVAQNRLQPLLDPSSAACIEFSKAP